MNTRTPHDHDPAWMDSGEPDPREFRQQVFHTPEGYFDRLPVEIAGRISSPQSARASRFPLWARVATGALVCGMALLLVFRYDSGNHKQVGENQVLTYQDLIESNAYYDFDERTLMEALPLNAESEAGSTVKAMKDYLIEQDADINLIINEL